MRKCLAGAIAFATSDVALAPAKPTPANPSTLGGGAFGGTMAPTLHGPAGITGRKLP